MAKEAGAAVMSEEETIAGSVEELEIDGSGVEYATIPGFKEGQTIRIGSVTAGDMIVWSEANEGEAKRNAGLRLITKSLVDKDGKRYADDPKNIARLRKLRHKETERIVKEILKLNGMSVSGDREAKKD